MSKLKSLTLKGYKSIEALDAFELGEGLNVLIGASGAGKSNFISIFRLLAELAAGRLEDFVQEERGASSLLFVLGSTRSRSTPSSTLLATATVSYTESGGQGETAIDQAEAIAAMVAKYEVCRGMLYGFSWAAWAAGTAQQRLSLIPAAREHLLKLEDGKSRFVSAVNDLSRAFALAVPSDPAVKIRDDVGFFQAVRAAMLKGDEAGERKTDDELSYAVRQIVSGAVASEGVIDIFSAAGLKKPDISILSDEFLMEVRDMPLKNVAVELLRKLLSGEIRARAKQNVVQGRSFAEMLEEAVRKYQNRAIETAQVIEELIALAKEIREANARGEKLGLSSDELAFYDALETNDSAVKVLARIIHEQS